MTQVFEEEQFSELDQARSDICAYRLDKSVNAAVFVDALAKYESVVRRDERKKAHEDKE